MGAQLAEALSQTLITIAIVNIATEGRLSFTG